MPCGRESESIAQLSGWRRRRQLLLVRIHDARSLTSQSARRRCLIGRGGPLRRRDVRAVVDDLAQRGAEAGRQRLDGLRSVEAAAEVEHGAVGGHPDQVPPLHPRADRGTWGERSSGQREQVVLERTIELAHVVEAELGRREATQRLLEPGGAVTPRSSAPSRPASNAERAHLQRQPRMEPHGGGGAWHRRLPRRAGAQRALSRHMPPHVASPAQLGSAQSDPPSPSLSYRSLQTSGSWHSAASPAIVVLSP